MCKTCGHIDPINLTTLGEAEEITRQQSPLRGLGGFLASGDRGLYIRQIFDRIIRPGMVSKENVIENFNTLYAGVEKGYGKKLVELDYTTPDAKKLAFMRANVFAFSCYKDYHNILAVNSLLLDSEGKARSFSEFQKEAIKIDDTFYGRYLETEYNLAQLSGRAASQWQEFEKNADIFPLLQYSTAGDANVRPEHQLLNGVIKPISDPFWNIYFPPNDWGCRCDVLQLTDDNAKPTPSDQIQTPELKPIFKQNVGKTGRVFPESHPYYEVLPAHKVAETGLFGMAAMLAKEMTADVPKKEVDLSMTKEESRTYKKSIEKQVKAKFQGKKFKIDGLDREFIVYGTGIDKAVQQKNKHETEKINALLNFDETIKKAKYLGSAKETKLREGILQHHYFEIIINDAKLYINIREFAKNGELQFWTITDSNPLTKK